MAQVTEAVAQGILNGQGCTLNEIKQLAHFWLANQRAAQAPQAPQCVCGEFTLGVVHRTDGPCYVAPPAQVQESATTYCWHCNSEVQVGAGGYTCETCIPSAPPAQRADAEPVAGSIDHYGELRWTFADGSTKVIEPSAQRDSQPPAVQGAPANLSDDELGAIYQATFNAMHGVTRSAPRAHTLVIAFARAVLKAAAPQLGEQND